LFNQDLGIDLGTANTLVFVRGKGIIFQESSVIAMDENIHKVLAVGTAAREMVGRTPANIVATNPLRGGVIADFDSAKVMLQHFIKKANRRRWGKPRVIIGIPSNVTEVERRAVTNAAIQAGCKEAYLIEEPIAAAIGADLDIEGPAGHMVVDIGGGTTDIAIISLGGIVASLSLMVAGNRMDEAIMNHVRKKHNLLLGERTAEHVKMTIGSALPKSGKKMAVRGFDMVTRLPKSIEISSEEVADALADPVAQITRGARTVIEKCPPELIGDIWDRGIVLTGGGALLQGMADVVAAETGLPTMVAENPIAAVALGTGKALEQMGTLKQLIKLRKN